MAKVDNKPTSIRWAKESKENKLKQFLLKEANENNRSLNYWINKILNEYKLNSH